MAAKFFALLTHLGAAKLSNMAALGEKLEITSLAVGDGGGVSPTPNQAQTKLINEVRRAQLNSLSVDKNNDSQIIAEQIIPESAGGWWIREIGLFDAAGDLIAIANCPETYKATTEEGSGRTQVIRMLLTVSSTDAVTLKVDPSVVLATRQYVDAAIIEVRQYADGLMMAHEADKNPHKQYLQIPNALKEIKDANLVAKVFENLGITDALAFKAPLESPSLTGTPTVPTAEQVEIDFRIANTAFVAQSISILNGGAPKGLNTLKKLALAINNDADFYTTVSSELGQKTAKSEFTSSKTSVSIVGNQPGGLRFMCGETSAPTDANGNVFITLPDTFMNRVIYSEAHQSKSNYSGDVDPFLFSSYPASNGPASSISFAVRNSKTGVPLINSAINFTYFVRGY